jgi:hypothetical protein
MAWRVLTSRFEEHETAARPVVDFPPDPEPLRQACLIWLPWSWAQLTIEFLPIRNESHQMAVLVRFQV